MVKGKERRKKDRRNFSYYMPVVDSASVEQVGVIVDISLGGFKLDSREPVPNGQVRQLCLYLTKDFAPQASLEFAGRSKWCRPDYIEPAIYNVGFELVNIAPKDALVYERVFEKFGSQADGSGNNTHNPASAL